ncbi:MAG: hypothetical protein ACLT76_15785 [Clostridium fessum]
MATVLLAALLGGCSFLSKEADTTEVSSKAETESPVPHRSRRLRQLRQRRHRRAMRLPKTKKAGREKPEDHFVEKKIVVATDMHYFCRKTGRKPL